MKMMKRLKKCSFFSGQDIEGLFQTVNECLKLAMDYKWFMHHNLTKKKVVTTVGCAIGRKRSLQADEEMPQ